MFGKKPTIVEVPAEVYDGLTANLAHAGASVTIVDGALDLSNVRLLRGAEPEPIPTLRHRPISTNKAPGAI